MKTARWISVAILLPYLQSAAAKPLPRDVVARAMDTAQHCTSQRIKVQMEQAGAIQTRLLEQSHGAMHLTITTTRVSSEVIAVGNQVYARLDAGAWIKSDHVLNLAVSLWPQSHFVERMTAVTVSGSGPDDHTYTGLLQWSVGGPACHGTMAVVIADRTHLPASLTFQGVCDTKPTTITETLTYPKDIVIVAPTL